MNSKLIDERILIGTKIDALGLSVYDRNRARAALAKAAALVTAFFAVSELLNRGEKRLVNPTLKPLQK